MLLVEMAELKAECFTRTSTAADAGRMAAKDVCQAELAGGEPARADGTAETLALVTSDDTGRFGLLGPLLTGLALLLLLARRQSVEEIAGQLVVHQMGVELLQGQRLAAQGALDSLLLQLTNRFRLFALRPRWWWARRGSH